MKVDCAHCAHRARCLRAPSIGLEVASPSLKRGTSSLVG
jgi:hypothetical protein